MSTYLTTINVFNPRLPLSSPCGREGGHSPPLGASGYPTRRGGRPPLQQLPSSSATQRAPAAAGPLLESSPSGWNSDISDIPQADENLFIPGTMFLALVRRACHHARVGLALGQPPSARLTSVYAVSQRDFSFEFRLRDYFLLGGSLSENYFLRGGSLSKGFAYTHFPFSTAQCV